MRQRNLVSPRYPVIPGIRNLLLFLLLICTLIPSGVYAQEASNPNTAEVTVLSQTMTPAGVNTSIQINVRQDSFLSSLQPNSNFGSATTLRLGWSSGAFDAMRILIQFDIGAIPPNAVINSAQLNIFQNGVVPGGDRNMDYRAQFMQSSWNEGGVTWNNANNLGGDALPLGTVDSATGWKTADVTNIVRNWYSGARANNGLIVTGDEIPANNRMRLFASRENVGFSPFIVVNFSTNCDTIAPSVSVNGLPTFSPGQFPVSWGGTDSAPGNCAPSGIANFDVDYRINGSGWHRWKNQTTSSTNQFNNWASNGDFVEFRGRGTDNAGNVQSMGNPQASTRIDTQPPSVFVNPLPPVTPNPFFTLSWSGTDNLSGVANYDVEWRENGGDWQLLREQTVETSFQVTGAQNGVTYDFRIRATDNVGNGLDWPDNPQATTTVSANSVATVLPFNPNILKPSAPITTSFVVNWQGTSSANAPLASVDIFFRVNSGSWRLWQNFPANQTSARFPFPTFGLGDGFYDFEAVAIDSAGQREPRTFTAEATMIVDLADAIHTGALLPMVFNQIPKVTASASEQLPAVGQD